MIRRDEVEEVGLLIKPHGISGEITAEIDVDPSDLRCIVIDVDSVLIPFFVESWRPKTTDTVLLKIDGIDSEVDAANICGSKIYALEEDLPEEEDVDGFYAADFVGFAVVDGDRQLGEISDLDQSTINALFVVETSDGNEVFIPVAEEFISSIDIENKVLYMSLPEGLIDL